MSWSVKVFKIQKETSRTNCFAWPRNYASSSLVKCKYTLIYYIDLLVFYRILYCSISFHILTRILKVFLNFCKNHEKLSKSVWAIFEDIEDFKKSSKILQFLKVSNDFFKRSLRNITFNFVKPCSYHSKVKSISSCGCWISLLWFEWSSEFVV